MEICPKCGRFRAERNHYNNLLYCYNLNCNYKEKTDPLTIEKKIKKIIENKNFCWKNIGEKF